MNRQLMYERNIDMMNKQIKPDMFLKRIKWLVTHPSNDPRDWELTPEEDAELDRKTWENVGDPDV